MPTPPLPALTNDRLLQAALAPKSMRLDRDPIALKQAFQWLGQQGLLGLTAPRSWGGQAWESHQFDQFVEQLTRYSGALAFLQIQHQRSISELTKSSNHNLQEQFLQPAIRGEVGIGVGYSHLRRSCTPVMAEAVSGGYVFQGEVPWVTGFGIFDYWLLAAPLVRGGLNGGLSGGSSGASVWVLVPFADKIEGSGHLQFGPPMELAAMGSTQTVRARLDNWFVPETFLVDSKPAGWVHDCDQARPLNGSVFPLGCARAGLDIVAAAQREDVPEIAELFEALECELKECRTAIYAAMPTQAVMHPIDLRAWAIDLASRCAHAAVVVSRGAANSSDHAAQRIYRESLAFTVFGQHNEVMQASLQYMTRRSRIRI